MAPSEPCRYQSGGGARGRDYANAVKSLVGTPRSNKLLSEQRAKAAVVKGGVAAALMSAMGWGQEKPLADNRTEDRRARNRRVEIVKKQERRSHP